MKAYFLLCGILCCTLSLNAQLSLQDSLVAWYPFDGDALDYSGNDNHGTVNGPILTTDRFGNPNSAYQFDGFDDFIEYVNNQKFQAQFPITVSAWVMRGDQDFNPVFLNNFQPDSYHGIFLNIPSSGSVSIAYGDGGPAGPNSRRTKVGTSTLALNQWYHVGAIIRDAFDMDIYINGKRDCGTYSGTGDSLAYFNGPGNSGHSDGNAQPNTGDFFFNGKIDDLRFYNRALDKSEIRLLADFPPQDTTFCEGDSLQLDAGYGSLLNWNPPVNLSCTSCSDPIASPIQSTVYTAITENTAGCSDTVDISIITKTCPSGPCDTVSFNLAFSTSLNGNDLTVIDQSSIPNNAQLDLTFGDGNSVGLQPGDTINYSYLSPGKYVICLEGVLALGETLICSDTICDTVDFVATAIESSSLGQSVNIYPNPSLGMLKVKFPQYPGSNSVLQLFDLQGKQVAVWPLADRLAHQFTVSSLPKGLYYLRIEHSEYFQGSQLIEIR